MSENSDSDFEVMDNMSEDSDTDFEVMDPRAKKDLSEGRYIDPDNATDEELTFLESLGTGFVRKRKPFPFLDLPIYIRKMILRMVLKRPGMVTPCHIKRGTQYPPPSMKKEQEAGVNISLLLANKQLHREAGLVLYGTNKFGFFDGKVSDWWFKLIGSTNRKRVLHANFCLTSGKIEGTAIFREWLWADFFREFESYQHFRTAYVSLDGWEDVPSDSPVHDQIASLRSSVVDQLMCYRGIDRVRINGGTYFAQRDAHLLAGHMMLARDAPHADIEDLCAIWKLEGNKVAKKIGS